MPIATPDKDRGSRRPPRRSQRHSTRKAPPRKYTLPKGARTEAASGQGYPRTPATPPQRPARRTSRGYTLPHQSTPRGDAGRRTTAPQRAAINAGVRDARLRVLRERARQDAARRRALGVMGNIDAGAGAVADLITRGATSVPTTGAGPTFGGLTNRHRRGSRIAAATAPRGVDLSESTVLRNTLKNAIAFPLLGPAALYEGGAAVVEGAQGNTDRAEKLLEGVTEGAIGLAAQGRWEELGKYIEENPLFALAEFRGGVAAAGRGAGAVARSGVAGERGRQIGTTARPDRELAPGISERRHYSPDLIVKGGQVLADRMRDGKPTPNAEGKLRKRADFTSDAAISGNRVGRDQEMAAAFQARPTRANSRAGRALDRRLPTGRGVGKILPGRFTRAERDVVPLVMQRVVRSADTLEGDLRKELGRLNKEYSNREQFRSGEQARSNRVQAQAIARVLSDPKALANAKEIARSADTLTRRSTQLEQRAINLGALDADSATRSKLFPYAQTHMDARYSDAPFQATRAREREAAADLRKKTTAQRDARVTHARKLTTAQRRVADARRTYLRRDETYAKLEEQHSKAKAEVKALRAALREADRSGKAVEVEPPKTATYRSTREWRKDADEKKRNEYLGLANKDTPMSKAEWQRMRDLEAELFVKSERTVTAPVPSSGNGKVTAAQLRKRLEEASAKRRQIGGQLAARAKALHDKPVVRTVKSGPNAGRKQKTGKAPVKRAERKVLAIRAERDKAKAETARARERFDAVKRERVAQQVGGRNVFKDPSGKEIRSFPTLHDKDGKRLTNEQIIDHMRKAGVPFDGDNPLVAYLPHRPDVRGARAYYQTAFAGRKDLNAEARTGEAQRKGTYENSYDLPTEHLVRLRGVIGRIEQHDQLIRDQGQKHPSGRYYSWEEAEDVAANLRSDSHGERIPGKVELVPMRVAPAKYDKEKMSALLERQDPATSPDLDTVMERVFAERLSKPENTQTKNVVLIPKATADRIEAQMRPAGAEGRVGNIAASLFRTTVLPFSFKWLVGNSAEAALRLGAVGAGPNTHRIGKKVLAELRKIDAEQARQAEAALIGGLQFGQKGLTVNRKNSSQFEGTPYEGIAKAIELTGKVPPVKLLVGSIKAYTNAVFGFNRWVEQNGQAAALGKWSKREMQEFTGSWVKANKALEDAVQEVAKGLLETKNQHDAAKYIDETLGKYSRFSPGMRRFIQQVAPFLPWYLNAIRFVGYTLPVKHPIKTALIVRVEETIQDDWEAQHANLPPGELKAAIPDGKGGWVDIARYGPFGAWTGPMGGAIEGIVDPFFPQFATAYKALATGSSFTGRKIKREPGDERSEAAVRGAVAINSLIEGFVPLLQIGRRIREGGSTPYDTSTLLNPKVKPGTDDSAANRILNPIRPIRLGAAPAKQQPAATVAPTSEELEFERMMRGSEAAAPEIDEAEFERMLRAAGG